jgi:metal-responsive CopG/Arc/MetJ family transcriptional regulator
MSDDIRPLRMYGEGVSELRTEKISVTLTPSVLARLDAYRQPRRWSRSTAIAALVEEGLDKEPDREASA